MVHERKRYAGIPSANDLITLYIGYEVVKDLWAMYFYALRFLTFHLQRNIGVFTNALHIILVIV